MLFFLSLSHPLKRLNRFRSTIPLLIWFVLGKGGPRSLLYISHTFSFVMVYPCFASLLPQIGLLPRYHVCVVDSVRTVASRGGRRYRLPITFDYA
jgi:hypothetical protein